MQDTKALIKDTRKVSFCHPYTQSPKRGKRPSSPFTFGPLFGVYIGTSGQWAHCPTPTHMDRCEDLLG